MATDQMMKRGPAAAVAVAVGPVTSTGAGRGQRDVVSPIRKQQHAESLDEAGRQDDKKQQEVENQDPGPLLMSQAVQQLDSDMKEQVDPRSLASAPVINWCIALVSPALAGDRPWLQWMRFLSQSIVLHSEQEQAQQVKQASDGRGGAAAGGLRLNKDPWMELLPYASVHSVATWARHQHETRGMTMALMLVQTESCELVVQTVARASPLAMLLHRATSSDAAGLKVDRVWNQMRDLLSAGLLLSVAGGEAVATKDDAINMQDDYDD